MTTSTHDSRTTQDSVAKLWNLCNVLKDDGVTYHQYVSELTYLLFLKMAQETGQEQGIPPQYRWAVLESLQGLSQLDHYKELLLKLGSSPKAKAEDSEAESLEAECLDEDGEPEAPIAAIVQEIFANASTFIKKPTTLTKLVSEIDKLDWYSAR
jgi:type I restriction enzyme M protein